MRFDHGLKQGDIIDNIKIQSIFMCSSQGGMRRSHRTNSLVIVSNYTRSIYQDRWEGEIFHYTGMGLNGDQSLEFSQNRTLAESNYNGVSVYLFEVFNLKHYLYQGQVELAGHPYQEQQLDENDDLRLVWVFPLRLIGGLKPADLTRNQLMIKQEHAKKAERVKELKETRYKMKL